MLHDIHSKEPCGQLLPHNQLDATKATASEPTISTIPVPSDIDPHLPLQYGSPETAMILSVAVLIRSVAMLIQVLVQAKGRKSEPEVGSQ